MGIIVEDGRMPLRWKASGLQTRTSQQKGISPRLKRSG
jgi:hypothetical protein